MHTTVLRAIWRWTTPLDLAIAGGIGAWAVVEAMLVPAAAPLRQLVFGVAISAPLAVRRRFPATVMLTVAVALVVHAAVAGADATFNPFPSLLVATYTVAERVRELWLSVALGLVPVATMLAAHLLGYFGSPGIENAGVAFLMFFVSGAWAAGRIVRARSMSLQRVAAGAHVQASEAAASERRRIARELHDIVAHSLSIVSLQAAAAEQFLERDPARARTHLELTRRTAQSALDEMRHLLEVLRESEASYAPQPGLSALPALIAGTEDAGHRCEMQIDDVRVSDGCALAAYRIVQEALTNVRKHAPGADVRVLVQQGDGVLSVNVENGPAAHRSTTVEGSGFGIPGMAERARVYGGTLEAGPTGRGWSVRASLPTAVPR
ncbi:sensor histidine kinase [Microbacterium sp. USHLN186]|uniref:sensor histidine kinase n=1 Tax=Microbacterium sp. USHLN186 TaxID=3081286 RepID=UPI00301A8EB9